MNASYKWSIWYGMVWYVWYVICDNSMIELEMWIRFDFFFSFIFRLSFICIFRIIIMIMSMIVIVIVITFLWFIIRITVGVTIWIWIWITIWRRTLEFVFVLWMEYTTDLKKKLGVSIKWLSYITYDIYMMK